MTYAIKKNKKTKQASMLKIKGSRDLSNKKL